MLINTIQKILIASSLLLGYGISNAQDLNLDAFVETEGSGHLGDNTPLWQVSNRDGLPSLDNYGYLRAGVHYEQSFPKKWRIESMLDMVGDIGLDKNFIIHQAYFDVHYKWLGLFIGSKERHFEQLNPSLSSGGLVWSGNSRPIPQIKIGAFDYVQICRRFAMKAEVAFGWWTDNDYITEQVGKIDPSLYYIYAKDIKYHTKSFYMRIGDPKKSWIWEMGYRLDTQFGGDLYKEGKVIQLGSGLKQYWQALIPQKGDGDAPIGEQIAYAGNLLGSELLKLTYQWKRSSVSVYMENYFDDFSGMGKLNRMDGLWGFEYRNKDFAWLNNLVFEYYQTTHQSGPLHGNDFDELSHKTGGADDYYNNHVYQGWTHWGRAIGNPLITSPMYNKNGMLSFLYNRVKAVHIGISGNITPEWDYRFKMSFNKTWGTVFTPIVNPEENFSAFAEFIYSPQKIKGWTFTASVAGDTGGIYGDNLGFQLRINKKFNLIKK